MIGVVVGVLALFTILSFIVALMAAFTIIRMSPKGARMRNYGRLGWWRFAEIEAELGPDAVPHIRTYKRAISACLICAAAGVLIGGVLSAQARV